MNEHLLGININFYLEKIDKLFMLQHHFFVGLTNITWISMSWTTIHILINTCKSPHVMNDQYNSGM